LSDSSWDKTQSVDDDSIYSHVAGIHIPY
jgi:hypothetical protein